MPNTPLAERILSFIHAKGYEPRRLQELGEAMGIGEEEHGDFHDACKALMHSGRMVLGSRNTVSIPDPPRRVAGTFRANPKGFGFLIPDAPRIHGDLYVPANATMGAMTGDRVSAEVRKKGKREGKMLFEAHVTEILQRGQSRFVGNLQRQAGRWYIILDGSTMHAPILIDDPGAKRVKAGDQVVVEVVTFPTERAPARGVIVKALGPAGEPGVDALSVIEQFQLPGEFPEAALEQARQMVASFRPEKTAADRLDLRDLTIITIDPTDAKDFDDAISLGRDERGMWELGVHIADVAHFVPENGPLDVEARERANSIYLPDMVIPMLPEVLSNGVCSLQEGEPRLTKSVFITFDQHGVVKKTAFANSVIHSTKRLTYEQASAVLDGKPGRISAKVVTLLNDMDQLAKVIRQRRLKHGMLTLHLPDNEVVFDEAGVPVDVVPEDTSFSHTIIEMFMVEANEAVARHLRQKDIGCLRRVHESSTKLQDGSLRRLIKFLGHELPGHATHRDLQVLLDAVKGKDEAFAINLAVLRSMEQAEYSPALIGHFALASDHYCHFTSPIRRYPDLTVHRLLDELLRENGRPGTENPARETNLESLGGHCSANERRAEAAERELKQIYILRLLEKQIGEHYGGVVTGIAQIGLFIQLDRYLIEGLVRFDRLSEDWWEVDPDRAWAVGQRTGRKIRIGDRLTISTARVDIAHRQLDLQVVEFPARSAEPGIRVKKARSRGKMGPKRKMAKGKPAARGFGKKNTRGRGRKR
jgi:ribonuclease R